MALMNLQDISLAFGGPLLLNNVNLQIQSGERICILGRNGTGKSSLMKIINGDMEADSGRILADDNLKTTLLTQNVPEDLTGTIYNVIEDGITSLNSSNADLPFFVIDTAFYGFRFTIFLLITMYFAFSNLRK